VGCRRVAPQKSLRRLTARDGRVVLDGERRAPGRGAYVCSPACLERAARRRALPRALRTAVTVDPQTLEWTH